MDSKDEKKTVSCTKGTVYAAINTRGAKFN